MNSFDGPALTLLEEHVRCLMVHMGFTEVAVHSRANTLPAAAEQPERVNLLIHIEAGDEGRLLIGAQGIHLSALQHVIRSLLRRQLNESVYITVDVNGYRARRERGLMGLAEAAARRAKNQGRTVVLKPMEAADRRAIHSALSARSDVRTESMGDEPNRRVVIRPIFL